MSKNLKYSKKNKKISESRGGEPEPDGQRRRMEILMYNIGLRTSQRNMGNLKDIRIILVFTLYISLLFRDSTENALGNLAFSFCVAFC